MNIYETAAFSGDQKELRQLASFIAEYLLPGAVPLSPPIDSDPVRFHLRQKEVLIGFSLYSREIGGEGFEVLLESIARLEAKRNEQHDPTLQEIAVCIAASGFSQQFLSRIPFELVRVRLVEWSLIHSDSEPAVLVRPIRKGVSPEQNQSKVIPSSDVVFPSQNKSFQYAPHELSTPELVSLTRFGMELRSRREHV